MDQSPNAASGPDTQLEHEVAEMIVAALNLDIRAEEIRPEAPLYGEGLGLDSIDILEVALVVSKQFGVQIQADSEENHHIFRSLRALTAYIGEHRSK
jgi:acyl carrier protein